MDHSEITSFITKFMGLLQSGKSANLNIKCEAGKAFINLYVEVQEEPSLRKPRNGAARQRRREQRAAAREKHAGVVVAEEASTEEVPEQDKEPVVSVKAAEKQDLSYEKKSSMKIVLQMPLSENLRMRLRMKLRKYKPDQMISVGLSQLFQFDI
jgi:hypothetical protein